MRSGVRRLVLTGAVALSAMCANSAYALTIDQLLQPGVNQLSDNTGEIFVNQAGPANTVDVGDIFLAVIEIDGVNGQPAGSGGTNELTGIFAVQVASVVDQPDDLSCSGAATCARFTFAAVADIQAAFALVPGLPAVPAAPANTLALLFEDPASNFTLPGSPFSTLLANAIDGTLRMVLTIDPGQIAAFAPADLSVIPPLPQGAFIGSIGGSATIVSETFALDFFPTVQLGGQVLRPNATEQFDIRDDITFTLVAVPEPMTASLLGSGLLMLGLLALRRRKYPQEQ